MENADKEERKFSFDRDFHEIVTNKEVLQHTTEKFLNNLIDDITLGIIFDLHRKFKTKAFNLDRDNSPAMGEQIASNVDIFGQNNMKKTQECVCPKCGRDVSAIIFAPHLESCMGMGRSRSRNASRRIANNNSKERENQTYSEITSDDEDDLHRNSGDKRRKKKYRNGNRKGKGIAKKIIEAELVESVNIDIEGDDDAELSNLRDLLQDNSNCSSPADSASTSNSSSGSSKKRDKTKNKKSSKRDRSNNNSND